MEKKRIAIYLGGGGDKNWLKFVIANVTTQ